jgi:serine/threonine-protein kinase
MTDPTTQTDPASPAAAPEADLTGRTLGDYRVLRRLGEGGMGQVYLAEQLSLKRNVALKILRPDLAANATSLQRFKAEAEAVAKVTHANIVQVYAAGEIDGLPYIALEYVEGRNLKDFVAKKGPPETLLALSIMRQAASALQRASEAGIVHRDIKPENILLTRKGEVKVADFGLSRCLDGDRPALNLTQSGVTMGTPMYMSPEQVEGKPLDSRTDIYSLGVTCYFMFAGRPPFDGATAFEVAMKHARDEPPPLAETRPDLPATLCAVIHKMMAKDPAQRYQTGKELVRDLARVREGLSGQTINILKEDLETMPGAAAPAPPVATTALMPRPSRRLVWIALVGVSLAAAAAAGGAAAWLRRPAAAAAPPPAADTGETDDDLAPVNDEEALRKLVDKYLQPAHAGADVSVGMGLCLDLGMLYLDQHRLDDAEKLFERLDAMDKVKQYQVLGKFGRAIVLALRDRPADSDQLLHEIANSPQFKKPKDPGLPGDPDIRKMVTNPQFRFWLSQAVYFNSRNALPEADLPKWFREPPKS